MNKLSQFLESGGVVKRLTICPETVTSGSNVDSAWQYSCDPKTKFVFSFRPEEQLVLIVQVLLSEKGLSHG
jgi:hypothetical protein